MTWDDGIEGVHREFAGSAAARIGVLAGPGTGKTSFGLMRRVVRLLEEGVPGERILLLSFTRVAAADLRDKVAALNAPGAENVRATTLHAYCFGLLQQESVLAITGRTPRILLNHEVDLMLRDIGVDYGTIHERRRLLQAFVAGWSRGIQDHPGVAGADQEREFENSVLLWLRTHRAMLIGEVVPLAHRFLTMNPHAPALEAFDHVIVDEYQDLNVLEQHLLDCLSANGSLCIAGDDDQSIYSVRYANPDGILSFLDRDEVEKYSITVCGRCPKNILGMANSLIAHAPGRTKDDLTPRDETSAGAVAIVQWADVDTEVDGIVSAIAADVGSERWEPGQILVLTNWRKIGESVRTRLAELEIPARSFFTEEELHFDEGRAALALLRLVLNEDDASALRVLLGLGDATGRTDSYQRILGYCTSHSCRPREVLERLASGEKLGLTVPALIKRFRWVVAKVDQLRLLGLPELVDALLPADTDTVADLRAVAVDALVEAEATDDLLRLVIEAVTQDDVPQNPDFVRVMSLHKSKGLTSQSVYVVAAVDGILPTITSDDAAVIDAAMREGRRLFYVAVTRAASELVISGSSSMDLGDANNRRVKIAPNSIRHSGGRHTCRTIASPYVAELGPDALKAQKGEMWLRNR